MKPVAFMPVYLNVKDICEMLQISRSTIYYQIENGGFPKPLKFGNTARWQYADVMQWINAQMLKHSSQPIETHKGE